MKKLSLYVFLVLLFCNVGFAASNADLIRNCAEYEYGKKFTNKEFQEIMTPENADDYHEFVEYFAECEESFKKFPITFKELFD